MKYRCVMYREVESTDHNKLSYVISNSWYLGSKQVVFALTGGTVETASCSIVTLKDMLVFFTGQAGKQHLDLVHSRH
jgi:hypothetical protein